MVSGNEQSRMLKTCMVDVIHSQRLVPGLPLQLLARVFLMFAQQLGSKLDISGLVDTVDVSEAGGNGEVGGDLAERRVDVPNILRLGV